MSRRIPFHSGDTLDAPSRGAASALRAASAFCGWTRAPHAGLVSEADKTRVAIAAVMKGARKNLSRRRSALAYSPAAKRRYADYASSLVFLSSRKFANGAGASIDCNIPATGFMIARWLVISVLLCAGCGGGSQKFNSVDITGANYARDFALTDHTGAKRTLADYRGKVVAVFFGFTQCPDVCPTTLSDLAQVKKRLGSDGERLQVIFITVDPDRDSQAVLQRYVPSFDPSFVALYGSAEQTAATAKEFKVFYQKVGGKTATSYSIDHTAGTYVFDREGRVRLFVRHGEGVEPIVADLKRFLS